MAELNFKKSLKSSETQEEQIMPRRLWMLLLLLLLLLSLSFSYIGYLIGKSVNLDDFTGRIVDTIELNIGGNGQTEDATPVTLYQFDITGTVLYTDGTPYRNGIIELRSDVRYTITDANGNFEFPRVTEGQHTISVIQGTQRLAYTTVTFTGASSVKVKQTIQLGNGHYLIKIPLEVTIINLVVELKQGLGQEVIVLDPDTVIVPEEGLPDITVNPELPGDINPPDGGNGTTNPANPTDPVTPGDEGETELPPIPDNPVTPNEPGNPDPPAVPDVPTDPVVPTDPGTPVTPVTPVNPEPGSPDRAPDLVVTDTIAPTKVWQQATAVDIFAPRDGNTGVSNIRGDTVIAPGAAGRYIFIIKNPEKFSVVYQINLLEEDQNFPKLPMRYRLTQGVIKSSTNDYYDWKSAQDVAVRNVTLAANSQTYYTLEWQWQDTSDSIDTAIGMQQGNPVYILDIIIGGTFR